ncbi:MAG: hypothetical protein IVW54_01730 [Candidatus Binataceae bacterium]|nr:hypothetical protein [Candidatus Binataceae bacterium]
MFKLRSLLVLALIIVSTYAWCPARSAESATIDIVVQPVPRTELTAPPSHGLNSRSVMPRHFANPALIRQQKELLASTRTKPSSEHGGHGKPTPSPTPTPTSTPTPAPPVPISQTGTSPTAVNLTGAFVGTGDTLYEPPDTQIAAGLNGSTTELLEAVNLTGQVFSTSGTLLTTLNLSQLTIDPSTDSVSDPRVLYDAVSQRWLILLITFSPTTDSGWDLAVSQTSDPSGGYNLYTISTANVVNPDGTKGNFPDFPKIGFNGNKVVITGDAFHAIQKHSGTSYKFEGTEFVVLNKSELVSGDSSASAVMFLPDQGDLAIEPALHLNPTSTPGVSPADNLYMAAVNGTLASTSTIDVWTVTGVPGVSTVGAVRTSLPIGTLSIPPNAQQAGSGVLIDTNDDSLLDAVFRDGSIAGSLWVSANDGCVPPSDSAVRSCLRFIEVSVGSGGTSGLSVSQDFDYAGQPGLYYYYPALRTDSSGDLATVFSGSSTSSFASVYSASRLVGDTANTLTNFSTIESGAAAYTTSPPRWGDYSGAGIDPDDSTIWIGGEYAASDNPILGSLWGTWIASVQP